MNTVAAILGDYATVASMDSFTASAHRSAPDRHGDAARRPARHRAGDRGRAAAGPSRIKALTGGDPITARFMRQDFFTYQPQFKLFVAGNHKPNLRNVDDAIRRRLHLIPFTFKPARPDRDLAEKLTPEWPAILAWAIAGCLEWQRLGLAPPPAVVEATAEYFAEEDAVGRWIKRALQAGGGRDGYDARPVRRLAQLVRRHRRVRRHRKALRPSPDPARI